MGDKTDFLRLGHILKYFKKAISNMDFAHIVAPLHSNLFTFA